MEDAELLKIALAVISILYSAIFGIIARKVWAIPETVRLHLDHFETKMDLKLAAIEKEVAEAHKRHDVNDRIVSRVIRREYSSKAVAESGIYPVLDL